MRGSQFQVFDKVANSTIPSYHNEENCFDNERGWSRSGQNIFQKNPTIVSKDGQGEMLQMMKEEEMEEVMKLNSDLFEGKKVVIRQYCKTDRL